MYFNQIRMANRVRQKQRPLEPTGLDFVLNPDHLPADFLKADLNSDGRHLIFANDAQLQLLARRWYIDGTFFVVR